MTDSSCPAGVLLAPTFRAGAPFRPAKERSVPTFRAEVPARPAKERSFPSFRPKVPARPVKELPAPSFRAGVPFGPVGERLAAFALTLLIAVSASAQRPPAEPPDTLVSPEVHPDRSVTFHLRAPKAGEVTVRGDWMPSQTREKLTKDNSGVWSVTLGPLAPDLYTYSFSIDGVPAIDPKNPLVKLGVRSSTSSMVEVPGDPPMRHEVRDVPHGSVEVNWYKSSTLATTRRFYVYTPPGYERNPSARYPVLYLLHGSGDTEGEWTWLGRANIILDNLLADGKVRPMIVVMPFGHAAPLNDTSPSARGRNTSLFESDLLKDVLPRAESKYRVAAGPRNHAIAGLSMGGGQSVNVGLNNLDKFGAVGVFSAGVGGGGPSRGAEQFESKFAALLADPEGTNKKLSVLWIGIGEQDPGLAGAQKLCEILQEHKIRYMFRGTPGAHTWLVWRRYLADFTQLLFRDVT